MEDWEKTLIDIKSEKIIEHKFFDLNELKILCKTLVNVMSYLEKNDISHRNLNLNSIVKNGYTYKLSEF